MVHAWLGKTRLRMQGLDIYIHRTWLDEPYTLSYWARATSWAASACQTDTPSRPLGIQRRTEAATFAVFLILISSRARAGGAIGGVGRAYSPTHCVRTPARSSTACFDTPGVLKQRLATRIEEIIVGRLQSVYLADRAPCGRRRLP